MSANILKILESSRPVPAMPWGNECVLASAYQTRIQPVPDAFQLVQNGIQLVQNGVQLVRNAFQLVQNDIQLVPNDIQLVPNTLRLVQKNEPLAILQNKDSKQSPMFSTFLRTKTIPQSSNTSAKADQLKANAAQGKAAEKSSGGIT